MMREIHPELTHILDVKAKPFTSCPLLFRSEKYNYSSIHTNVYNHTFRKISIIGKLNVSRITKMYVRS